MSKLRCISLSSAFSLLRVYTYIRNNCSLPPVFGAMNTGKPLGLSLVGIPIFLLMLVTSINVLHADEFVGSREDAQCTGPSFEISGYGTDSVHLDYKGNSIILRFSATDAIIIQDFNPNDAFSGDGVFQFSGESLCRRELVMRGFDIAGTEKSEILTGTNATDRITGHAGNDTLNGGPGDDTYIYNLGDGLDCISDPDGHNSVVFGQGVSAESLISRITDKNGLAVVEIRLHDPRGRIRSAEGLDIRLNRDGVSPIDAFHFADGKSLDMPGLMQKKTNQESSQNERNFARACIFDIKEAERAGMVNERAKNIPRPRMPVPVRRPG